VLGVASNVAGAVTMPLWPKIGRLLGKRNAFMLSNGLLAAVYATWLLAKPGDPMSLLVVRGVLSGFLSSGMILMGVSMLTDTMAYDRQVSGLRREGIFSSFYALVEKVGFALGPALIGGYIAAAGYVPTTGGKLIAQPASAITALYVSLGVIAPAFLLAGGAVMIFYKLDETVFAKTGD
jgi:GPH family glycoside/pentoside/hexuronide:cation symporter